MRLLTALSLVALTFAAGCARTPAPRGDRYAGPSPDRRWPHFEQRNMPAFLRGPHNQAFFFRHNDPYSVQAGIHFAHGKAHDVPQLTPLDKAYYHDAKLNAESEDYTYSPPHIGPDMEMFGPYVGRMAYNLYRTIDWTHVHHDQTYDVMASRRIPWDEKKAWTDKAVAAYIDRMPDTARSVAPLDVTMRRAGVMMKPYFTLWRNNYPRSNNYFWFAHWWHPAIYEAQMIAGNDDEQEEAVRDAHNLSFTHVLHDRPGRMLLSREMMPRYSRMSPESGNIFDNLHMLHGIAYDILAYEGYTEDEKRAEIYRVVEAMSYRPGDEQIARKFPVPYPDMDPRVYADWMKGNEGEMSRIMMEMMREMWPTMSPDGSAEVPEAVMAQFMMKNRSGTEEGEHAGSLHDALMKVAPDMKMTPEMQASMAAGVAPQAMIDAMLAGWREKHGDMPDAPGIDMSSDPALPPLSAPRPAAPAVASR